jgi:zinc protease
VSATLPVPEKREVLLVDIPNKQNIEFSVGGVLPLYPTDPEYRAFTFGMSVLGLQGGFSGRLMSTVREKEGLTYSIYGKPEKATKTEQGFWRIMTFFNPKDAVRGITSTLTQVEKMRKQGITEDELVRFKAIIETRIALKEDSLLRKLAELQNWREAGLTEEEYQLYRNDIANMTVERVNGAMKKYLDPKKIAISGAGPVSKVRKDLERFALK